MNFKKCMKFLTRWSLFEKKAKDEGKRGKKNVRLAAREEGEEFPMDQKIVSSQEEEAVEKKSIQDVVVVDLVDSSVDKLQTEVQIKADEGNNKMTIDENPELNNNSLIQKVEGEIEPTNETATGPTEEEDKTIKNVCEREVVEDLVDNSVDKLQTKVQIKADEGNNKMTIDKNPELNNNSLIQKIEGEIERTNETATGPTEEKVAMENMGEVADTTSDPEDGMEDDKVEGEPTNEMVTGPIEEKVAMENMGVAGDMTSDPDDGVEDDKVEREIEPTNEMVTGPIEEKVAMENMGEVADTTSDPEDGMKDDKVEGEPTNETATGPTEEMVAMENMGEVADTTSDPEDGMKDDKVEGEPTNEMVTGPIEEKVAMENMGEAGDTTCVPEDGVVDDADQKDDMKGRAEELSEQLVVKTKENTALLKILAEMDEQLKDLKNEQQVKQKETSAEYDRMAKKIDIVKTKNRMLRLQMMEMGKKLKLTERKLQETVKLSSGCMGMLSSEMENFKKDWNESKEN